MKTQTKTHVFSSLVYLFLALMGATLACIVWAVYYDLPNLYHPAPTIVACHGQPPCCHIPNEMTPAAPAKEK